MFNPLSNLDSYTIEQLEQAIIQKKIAQAQQVTFKADFNDKKFEFKLTDCKDIEVALVNPYVPDQVDRVTLVGDELKQLHYLLELALGYAGSTVLESEDNANNRFT